MFNKTNYRYFIGLILIVVIFITVSVFTPLKLFGFIKGKNSNIQENKKEIYAPIRLRISELNIDAPIESLGLTSSGAMDAPVGTLNVGWLNIGTIPGQQGSAVIDGHSGYKGNTPAVFDDLYKLKKGDKVSVENSKGEILNFIVKDIKSFDPNDDATSVFTSSDGIAHLNLITCSGDWNEKEKSHTKRLVVFTDIE